MASRASLNLLSDARLVGSRRSCLVGEALVCPLPLLIIQVMGRLGSPLPMPGKNLIMA
jgi:hypothetical protein